MDNNTVAFYSSHASELARVYSQADGGIAQYFDEAFNGLQRVLDVGCGSGRTCGAVKRLIQDAEAWIFRSDNPAYKDIRVAKSECQYPILGTMVAVLKPVDSAS